MKQTKQHTKQDEVGVIDKAETPEIPYFEDLDYFAQEILLDLIASGIQNKIRKERIK